MIDNLINNLINNLKGNIFNCKNILFTNNDNIVSNNIVSNNNNNSNNSKNDNSKNADIKIKKIKKNRNGKKTILIAGYDLKFIDNIIKIFNNNYNILIDQWTGHNNHNKNKSYNLLIKSDIIICEWFLGNVIYYSENKLDDQKLYVRLHRVEIEAEYIRNVNINKIDKLYFVSPSWYNYSVNKYKFLNNINKDYLYNDLNKNFEPKYKLIKNKFNNIKNNEINIGMCGILPFELKDPMKIIEIIKELKKKYIINFKLFSKRPEELNWINNKYPNEIEKFTKLENYLKENTNYNNYNYINNDLLYNYFINLDILLVTSKIESFHKSSLESLMAGVIPIFYGDYVNMFDCKMNWINDFCYEDLNEVINFINFIKKNKKLNNYLQPIIENYWNKYNTNTIYNILINEINNKKINMEYILLCFQNNFNYLDGSVIFIDNIINILLKNKKNIILILPNQKSIYLTKRNYFNKIYHYHILNKNEKIEDIINKYNNCFNITHCFIRGFNNINLTLFNIKFQKKIIYYLINNNNIKNTNIKYITQTDKMKNKYNCKISNILYPTCYINHDKMEKNKDKIKILYIGTIREEFESLNLIKILINLSFIKNFNIKLYISKIHGNIEYKKEINDLLNIKHNIKIYYNIEHEIIKNELKDTNYGFNFKNIKEEQKGEISTKIIEYIAYKIFPIINKGCDEEILFNKDYPFIINNINNIDINNLIENINIYKNKNIYEILNKKEIEKYSNKNFEFTINEIFN